MSARGRDRGRERGRGGGSRVGSCVGTVCVNEGIVEMLREKMAAEEGSYYAQTLARAVKSIAAVTEPIRSKRDALRVKFVGEGIATLVEVFLAGRGELVPDVVPVRGRGRGRGASAAGLAAMRRADAELPEPGSAEPAVSTAQRAQRVQRAQAPSGAMILDSDDDDMTELERTVRNGMGARFRVPDRVQVAPPPAVGAVESAASPPPKRRRQAKPHAKKVPKEYIPRFRSCPYAVLIALLEALDRGETTMSKTSLAAAAQKYADEPIVEKPGMVTGASNSWFVGWTSVSKTLIPKGLVAKGGSPARYGLSAAGAVLARKLVEMNSSAERRTVEVYHPRVVPTPSALGSSTEYDEAVDLGWYGEEAGNRSGDLPLAEPLPVIERPQVQRRRSQPVAPALTTANANAEEFGEVTWNRPTSMSPCTSPPSPPGHGSAASKAFTPDQVERSTRVIAQLESCGVPKEKCMAELARLFKSGNFPDTDEELFDKIIATPDNPPAPARARTTSIPKQTNAQLVRHNVPPSIAAPYRLAAVPLQNSTSEEGVAQQKSSSNDSTKTCPSCGAELPLLSARLHMLHCRGKRHPAGNVVELDNASRAAGTKRHSSSTGLGASDLSGTRKHQRATDVSCVGATELLQRQSNFPPSLIDLDNSADLSVITQPSPLKVSASPVVIALDDESEEENDVVFIDDVRPSLAVQSEKEREVTQRSLEDREPPSVQVQDYDGLSNVCEPLANAVLDSQISLDPYKDEEETENDEVMMNEALGPKLDLIGRRLSVPSPPRREKPPSIDPRRNLFPASLPEDEGDLDPECDPGQECEVVFVLDAMERLRSSDSPALESITAMLEAEGVRCDRRALPCGDAMFVAKCPDGSEVVLDYIVERKTLDDFIHSDKDGRIARQSYNMRHSQISKRIFVLEGDLRKYQLTETQRAAVHKKLAELTTCEGFFIKYTDSLKDTVWFYTSMFRRLHAKHARVSWPSLLRGGRPLFQDWDRRMTAFTRSVTLEQMFMLQLTQIPGIATGRAHGVLKMGYRTPASLFKKYIETSSPRAKEELLCDSENPDIPHVSVRVSRIVHQLFMYDRYDTQMSLSEEQGLE